MMPRLKLSRNRVAAVLPVIGLIAMLLALAFLQLRWSARVSDAERDRLERNLARSTRGLQSAFAQDLLGLSQTLQAAQSRPPAVLIDHLSNRYLVWSRIGRHAALVEDLFLWQPPHTLSRLDPTTGRLQPAAASNPLQNLRLEAMAIPRSPDAWTWYEPGTVLIHPLYTRSAGAAPARLYGYLLVVLNLSNFEQVYLPGLGRRYFSAANGLVFELLQQSGGRPRVVFSSPSGVAAVFQHADAILPLLDGNTLYRPVAPSLNPVVLSSPGPIRWWIAIRYRSGSLDAAVRDLRRRNLAISLIVLLLVAISLVLMLRATRRAQRLARLQMEFASGVSHELRTPLAVIRSAAENLADGVVAEPARVRDYGALIHKESRHLAEMVDHILDFARRGLAGSVAMQDQFETSTVTIVVNEVLDRLRPQIEGSGSTIHLHLEDDLPPLRTVPKTLGQCLENLLGNSMQYAGPNPRILLHVSRDPENSRAFLLFRVQDNGPGIPLEEIPQIYEPFYRGRRGRESHAHGAGLGLSLTRRMMEDLGGRITLENTPGEGSAFTLHVPIAGCPMSRF